MIYVQLKDGTRRALDQAKSATITWEGPDGDTTYELSDLVKLVMIEPELKLAAGNIGGMPVVGLALVDLSDLSIETPMPVDYADDLGAELPKYAQAAREAASKIEAIRRSGEINLAQSMADVARVFGNAAEEKPGPSGAT